MAFGTGSHATTRLCVGELIEVLAGAGGRGLSVLDVGCGTGVLAIAAVKLGAGKAVGTDIDPMAVRAARRNVRANGVKALMTERPVEKVSGRFDVVVANILSGELVRLAPELVKKTAHGGLLILSGILVTEAAHVAGVFVDAGMEPGKRRVLGEWAALVLRRPAGRPLR
jgi:ribosomal protein L11 methyltransferase